MSQTSPTEASPQTPFFLVAKLTATNVTETEKLRDRATELARYGSHPVAVESESGSGVVSIKGAVLSHIQKLVDELRGTSAPQFSAEPTGTLNFETIQSSVNGVEGKHEVDHQHARVVIDLFTLPAEDEEEDNGALEVRFVNEAKDSIPADFTPACENAFREACKAGPLKGYPVTRIGMRLQEGSQSGESVRASHFSQATVAALKTAFSETKFVLLEPVIRVEANVRPPNAYDILADFFQRGASLVSQEQVDDWTRLTVVCPPSSLVDYEFKFRTLSRGAGHLSMAFDGYKEKEA
jgi:elongation factor G